MSLAPDVGSGPAPSSSDDRDAAGALLPLAGGGVGGAPSLASVDELPRAPGGWWKALTATRVRAPRLPRLLEWLPSYSLSKLGRDLSSALVVTTLLVPQSMSYARLAGARVEAGLYSSIVPLFAYGLLTTAASMQFGIVAPTSILANSIVTGLVPPGAGGEGSDAFAHMHGQLAFASGAVLAGMSLLQLGWLAHFISGPVIVGFTWGSALLIIASQLADLLGLPVVKQSYFG